MENELRQLLAEVQARLLGVNVLADLEVVRIEVLGRKGKLAELLKGLAVLDINEKKVIGVVANEVKMGIERAFAEVEDKLSAAAVLAKNESEWLDMTMPGVTPEVGHTHLTTQAIEDITNIFAHLGFVRARHPEVDWDYYAFEAMNMPSDHPARDDWETFFVKGEKGVKGKMVLTPHTSNGQVREMEKGVFPIRMISIGKCFRRQADVRHLPSFYQFEGLVIDKKASVTELKGVCDYFAKSYFGPDRVTRLRPYHFRFTEPSFELDVSCSVCSGTGKVDGVKCKLCKEGWLELGGAGMVHPNVIKAGGLDPDEYSGFAFGWGVERTMMMRAGLNIDDIRILYKNDLRFIRQF
jgi:phenylalanyl-tRNA synthetase alpha chain